MTLLVVFGNTPELAWQELISVIPTAERTSDHAAIIHDATVAPADLMEKLGGAIKIGRLVSVVKTLDAQSLAPILSMEKFRTFGISTVDTPPVNTTLLGQIKEKMGRPTRFVLGQLSSVVITKQRVFELVAFPYRGKFGIAATIAVQDFEAWSKRDRGRPHADPKAGMLPPKVGRMLVNIAGSPLSSRPPSRDPVPESHGFRVKPGMTQKTLLDPFCGMGTILAEALLLGWQVIGSDQSEEVVVKAQANLRWLGLKTHKLFTSDATHISEKVESVDAIVTEPFMGKPNVSRENVKDIMTGLSKLYIGCLKDWRGVLKPGGRLVMAFPRFTFGEKSFFVKKVIDSCETLGYTVLAGPIEYARPSAVVKREIYVLRKN